MPSVYIWLKPNFSQSNKQKRALLDSKSEINIIHKNVALESGLAIKSLFQDMHNIKLIAANGTVKSFLKTVVTIITIGAVLIKTTFLVVRTLLFSIILGEPYGTYMWLATQRTPFRQVSCIIISEDRVLQAQFLAKKGFIEVLTPLQRFLQTELVGNN